METFSPKDKVVDIIKEYPTTRILFDEVSHFDDTASAEDFCFKNSIDIFSFWNKLSKEMRIQTEDKLRLDSIAEQQMREEKILADRDLERYKRTHRNLFCEETKYMPKRRNVFVSFLSSF